MDLVELFKSTDMPTMANFNEKLNKINNLFSETDGGIGSLSDKIDSTIDSIASKASVSDIAEFGTFYVSGNFSIATSKQRRLLIAAKYYSNSTCVIVCSNYGGLAIVNDAITTSSAQLSVSAQPTSFSAAFLNGKVSTGTYYYYLFT